MANGFFLGGAAEGMMNAQKMGLAERELDVNTALKTRGFDMQGRQLEHNISQDITKQADAQIANTMAVAAETIKAGLEGGADPAKLKATVAPLVQSAQSIAARIGRDPAALAAQIDAQLAGPGPVATAAVQGRAAGTKTIEQERAIQNQPPGTAVEISPFKDPKDRVAAEASLRDDFVKASKDFGVIRDFHDRMQTAPTTGAGDIALVFSYMKMLDPGSTVREGEYATARNASGIPDRITGLYNRAVDGEQLPARSRKELKEAAGKIWESATTRHTGMTNQYAQIAKRQGLRPENVIIDANAGAPTPAAPAPARGTGNIPPPPKNFQIVNP
jgi:hypothetical protein